jgi:TetR/AcrR family transcriptional regulator, regulator of cefoperazone and chloramphenicol sensitivity
VNPNLIARNAPCILRAIRRQTLDLDDQTMARRTISRTRLTRAKPEEDERQSTRQQLLEAAGQVFAEKGFERSTAKEISERAHTNTAAVNYYFGGIEGLYAAVLEEARNSIFSDQTIATAIAGKTDPKAKLEAVFATVIQTLLGPVSSSWVLRVLGRDMVTPTAASDAAKEKLILPRALVLRRFVSEFVGLPEDHPTVARACVSIMAPFCMLILADRRRMKRALPSLALGPGDAPDLARHLAEFALGGLEAVRRDARRQG